MSWHRVCNTDEVDEGQGREFLIEATVIAIFRIGADWLAVDGMCAHQGGPLAQGHVDGTCITCPWHGWQYDLTTGCNLRTGKEMLARFPLQVRDDELWIELG